MRFIKLDKEQKNVPVFKNVLYALRLVWESDKKLILGYLMVQIFGCVFSIFIQNILFLKILLEIINGNNDYRVYIKCLVMFAVISIVTKAVEWYGERVEQFATKNVLKCINNKIFEKANSLDISCYEDPEFYDKYQRATLVVTSSYFDLICWEVATIIAQIIALACVIATVSVINPVYLLFWYRSFLFLQLNCQKAVRFISVI